LATTASQDFSHGHRLAVLSVVINALLSALNVTTGWWTGSTSTVALGFEFAGDVLASAVVLVGLRVALLPPDANHPYGHGRMETVAGLLVGFILVAGGVLIVYRSLDAVGATHPPPGAPAVWVIAAAIAIRSVTTILKFRIGRRGRSTALVADAWNDAVDILSAAVALVAVVLARANPERFLAADHYGGVAVGLIVVVTGVRVVRDATLELADTMPTPALTAELRAAAMAVPGVFDVEKQFARKTGLQYHVDLHIEVDPELSVRASHRIAHDVKRRILADLPWVADVLVHVEPFQGGDERRSGQY
jgi:cation diffusion facilitator family transporter